MLITKDNNYNQKYNSFYDVGNRFSSDSNSYYFTDSERLGFGGNGAVYECVDNSGKIWAVKFLLHFSQKAQKRFKQEIDILRKLDHPHIIKYIDDGSMDGIDTKTKDNIIFLLLYFFSATILMMATGIPRVAIVLSSV